MVAYGTHTSAFSTPPQRKTQSPLLHSQHTDTLPTVPQVSNRPLVLPMEGASPFWPYRTWVCEPGPPTTQPPPGTHLPGASAVGHASRPSRGCTGASLGLRRAPPAPGQLRAPPPPGAAPLGPLVRARLQRPRGPASAALRSVGRSDRPRPVPRAPRPRPRCYLPAEPHDPVQLGLILKQVPELPGAEDPKAPRAAGLRPRPRRPGPVHAARPRPQLGCWLGPLGPLRPGSAPLRLRLRDPARARSPAARGAPPPEGAPPALKGDAAWRLGVGRGGGGPHPFPPRWRRASRTRGSPGNPSSFRRLDL